jgi:hypothetical protein
MRSLPVFVFFAALVAETLGGGVRATDYDNPAIGMRR